MTSGIVAGVVALLVLVFVEVFARSYPSRQTWDKLRRVNGPRAIRAMRERMEAAAESPLIRRLATLLLALVIVWVAAASLLDKRWYEVVADVAPYGLVLVALLRLPSALRRVAARIKGYEKDAGEDPERALDEGGGPTALAL